MKHRKLAVALLGVGLVIGLLATAQAKTIAIPLDEWHGGGCTCCGEIDYACRRSSGDDWSWGNPQFMDPLPAEATVHRLTVRVYAGFCAPPVTAEWRLNGVLIESRTNSVDSCACGSCTTYDYKSAWSDSGFAGWNYGGTNTLTCVVTDGTLCVSEVDLIIEYTDCIDTSPPVTTFVTTPPNPDNNPSPYFEWVGIDAIACVAVPQLVYSTNLDGAGWSSWSPATSSTVGPLSEG
ncbi:hypothetical protein IH601_04575, partial [Candidatus Bipolaricaulota bacterium]|nr:hypothetical protein [Candidatus Bipolaricaulota bacterium]